MFAKLPGLVERAGNGDHGEGSITAFYTVLTEGDDTNDPVADAARGILDGHIVLSRDLAEAGHYPAIDVEASISRVMTDIADPGHLELARQLRRTNSTYRQNRDLISIGAYQRGSDPRIDELSPCTGPLPTFCNKAWTRPSILKPACSSCRRCSPVPRDGCSFVRECFSKRAG